MSEKNTSAAKNGLHKLVYKLCFHLSGRNKEDATRFFRLATQILFQTPYPYIGGQDEYFITENIKKKLALTRSEKEAYVFADLYRKLQGRAPLKNRQAILAFLFNISESQMSHNSSSQYMGGLVASETKSVESIHRSFFALPSLSSSVSSSESTPALPNQLSSSSSDQSWHHDSHGLDYETLTHRSSSHQSSGTHLYGETTKLSKTTHTIEVSESQLLQELIFIFQGIDGKILKLCPVSQGYKLDPKLRMKRPVRRMVLRLAELGWLHNQVRQHCENSSGAKTTGLIGQSLVKILREELTEYYRLVANLQSQIKQQIDTSVDSPLSEEQPQCHQEGLTLLRLSVSTMEPMCRMKWLAAIVDACKKKKGGALASCVHGFLQHGDPVVRETVKVLLGASMMDTAYLETSRRVLDVLHGQYKFLDHLQALRRYLLLGQGDFIRYLMELLEPELIKPATVLYPHILNSILDSAIRATNAQFEDADILNRLDVRMLEQSPGDTGWDVFSLDYHVDGPIGTIFAQNSTAYLMLFNALWRAKRMEWILSRMWKRQITSSKLLRKLPELTPVLQQAHLLTSEMVHFIHQMQYYILFEVLECSWDILIKRVQQAEALDDIISAHENFLLTVKAGALLDENSRELATQLRTVYELILQLQTHEEKLYTRSLEEVQALAKHEELVNERGKQGQFGTSAQEEELNKKRIQDFKQRYIPNVRAQLRVLSNSYQDVVKKFLLMLASQSDVSLQLLSFRLDFNEHYKRLDSRLTAPHTYQHRRLSEMGLGKAAAGSPQQKQRTEILSNTDSTAAVVINSNSKEISEVTQNCIDNEVNAEANEIVSENDNDKHLKNHAINNQLPGLLSQNSCNDNEIENSSGQHKPFDSTAHTVPYDFKDSSIINENDNQSNNNATQFSFIDNRISHKQNKTEISLKFDENKLTFFGHAVHLNRIEDGIPENNNGLILEVNDTKGISQVAEAQFLVLENGSGGTVYEYCGKVEDKSYRKGSDAYISREGTDEIEVEGTDSCESIDEIGIDTTNLINGNASGEFAFEDACLLDDSQSTVDSGSNNIDTSYEQWMVSSVHSSSHSLNNSCIENTTTEIDDPQYVNEFDCNTYLLSNDNDTDEDDNTDDGSLECSIDQVSKTNLSAMTNSSSECCSNEQKDIKALDTLNSSNETITSNKTGAILKSMVSTASLKWPIVDPQDHASYGSTAENEKADSEILCTNEKSDFKISTKLKKPMKNKKKEPGIT
ncbi:hypothetical protein C0J52_15165 [Blattella germanica]|nr:hypothetical protein C0J52_15165 [Blattella germanica]